MRFLERVVALKLSAAKALSVSVCSFSLASCSILSTSSTEERWHSSKRTIRPLSLSFSVDSRSPVVYSVLLV